MHVSNEGEGINLAVSCDSGGLDQAALPLRGSHRTALGCSGPDWSWSGSSING